jgi:hypothetical protein
MGNYVPYVKRATIIDLIDTPAYAEFRTRAGLDREVVDRTTTRGVKVEGSSPPSGPGNNGSSPSVEAPHSAAERDESRHDVDRARNGLPPRTHDAIAAAIGRETSQAWTLKASCREADWVQLRIQTSPGSTLDLEVGPAGDPHLQAFLTLDGVAFRYAKSDDAMSQHDLRRLEAVARKLRSIIRLTPVRR